MGLKFKQSLAVIIPMYNEEKVGGRCVDEVIKVLKTLDFPTVLIAVNDGSKDNTEKILLEKKKKYRNFLTIVSYKKNKGYGGAIWEGLKMAEKQHFAWVLHMDSDLTNDPQQIKDFAKFINSPYDCIKASRYIKGGKVDNVPLFRRIVSVIGNTLANKFFNIGIKDCTNGFRMVKVEKLKGLKFKEKNFSIILEELYYLKKRGARFAEMPYTLTARKDTLSHFRYRPKIFFDYFKYAFLSLFA